MILPSLFPLHLGVKTDPIEYRYSFEWLCQLLAEERVERLQLGTFFEIYQLPDEWFADLRQQAESFGVSIMSVFTAHRELGGFFRDDPAWEQLARHNFERLIEVGAILGATAVGHNPGAVPRDRIATKERCIERYLGHMKELLHVAHDAGLQWLTFEPMSCLAEPPSLPDEIARFGATLRSYHEEHPDQTARPGICGDISHGYADRDGTVVWDNFQILDACLPYLCEIHLKNTDSRFESTFGFTPDEREVGTVDIARLREHLLANSDKLPVPELTGFLEISGPKLGRDYSDYQVEAMLRESLRYLKETFEEDDGKII